MKKLILSAISILTVMSLVIGVSATVYFKGNYTDLAFNDVFSPRLTCDPDEIKIYITTSSYYSDYVTGARSAMNSWTYSSGAWDIKFNEISSSSSSYTCFISIYDRDSSSMTQWYSSWGFTKLFYGDGPTAHDNVAYDNVDDLPDADYWGGAVYMNYKGLNNDASSPINMNKSVVAHELGHILGLFHYGTASTSIMCSSFATTDTTVHTPTTSDKDNVIYLYQYR